MIRYALACDHGHSFESWFADSLAYDKQRKRALVACPQCGSTKIEKALMAPRLGPSGKRRAAEPDLPARVAEKTPVAVLSPHEKELRQKLKEIRDHLTKNADHV
jgi:hypothetical protein